MSKQGIDISSWQEGINLSAVPADFVIVKATEGKTLCHRSFKSMMAEALATKKLVGVYHYACGGNAKEEADWFLTNIKEHLGKVMLFLDWEGSGNSLFGSDSERAWIKEWCEYIEAKTSVCPVIYIQQDGMRRVEDLGYELWVAQYGSMNETGYQDHPWNEGAYECLMRQYSSCGVLSGYAGHLDLNIFYGSEEDWLARTKKMEKKAKEDLLAQFSDEQLADKVIAGEFGNDDVRVQKLGNRYSKVQAIVNARYKAKEAIKEEVKDTNTYHVVKAGETLSLIAEKYGTTYTAIAKANGIKDPNVIYANQKLLIPNAKAKTTEAKTEASKDVTYAVKAGDTLSAIGNRYGVHYTKIAEYNNISNPDRIFVGQVIKIPKG